MKKVVLVGSATTANILYSYLQNDDRYEIVGVTVDEPYLDKGGVEGLPAVGLSGLVSRFPPQTHVLLMAAGYDNLNRVRESLFTRTKELGYSIETYVHPQACVNTQHPLGEGAVVLPSAVIEPHARVGSNAMIWSNVTVAHHASVGDHCWIAAGTVLSGFAKILRNTFVGVNATVVNEVTVGEYNIVGAAAMMSKDTKSHAVHLARSAEPFRYSSEDYVKFFGV